MPVDPFDGSHYEDPDSPQKTEDELEFDREVESTPDEYYKSDPDDD